MAAEVKVGVVYEPFTSTGIPDKSFPDKSHDLAWAELHLMVETPLPVRLDGSAVRELIVAAAPTVVLPF